MPVRTPYKTWREQLDAYLRFRKAVAAGACLDDLVEAVPPDCPTIGLAVRAAFGRSLATDESMVRAVNEPYRRSWRERLFSRPWRPWRAMGVRTHVYPLDNLRLEDLGRRICRYGAGDLIGMSVLKWPDDFRSDDRSLRVYGHPETIAFLDAMLADEATPAGGLGIP